MRYALLVMLIFVSGCGNNTEMNAPLSNFSEVACKDSCYMDYNVSSYKACDEFCHRRGILKAELIKEQTK